MPVRALHSVTLITLSTFPSVSVCETFPRLIAFLRHYTSSRLHDKLYCIWHGIERMGARAYPSPLFCTVLSQKCYEKGLYFISIVPHLKCIYLAQFPAPLEWKMVMDSLQSPCRGSFTGS